MKERERETEIVKRNREKKTEKDKTDAKFAIKAMKKKEIIDSKHVDHIENEKKILEVIEHPFIVSKSNQS